MHFNMNRTWSQAVALVRANFQLLAVIAGVFLLLPALVWALVMPEAFDLVALSENPEAVSEAMSNMMGPLMLYGLVGMVLQFIGYAAMVALIGEDRPTVGEAIMLGVRCLLTIFAAALLFVVAYVALVVLASLLIGLIAGLLNAAGGEGVAGVLAIVMFAALSVAVVYTMTRLSLTLPVVVLEGVRNPVAAFARSWHLTRRYGGAIFGFYLLLLIAYVVISILLLGLAGVIGAVLGTGAGAALFTGFVNGLISAFVAMVMSGILVSMHQQLAGRSSPALGATFK